MRIVYVIWIAIPLACALVGCAAADGTGASEGGTLRGSEAPRPEDETPAADSADTGVPWSAPDDTGETQTDDDDAQTGDSGSSGSSGGGGWVCDKEIRNGSEICDDAKFDVPSPYTKSAIYCIAGEGGVGYVSTNTGPTMSDGVARCQGWEETDQNAWDHLQYVETFICAFTDDYKEVDLSSWEGDSLWVGVHDLPSGGGTFTHVCIAHWVE